MKEKEVKKTLGWILCVLLISFLCYVPMLLQKQGVPVPEALVAAKYFFVLTPILISFVFYIMEKREGRFPFLALKSLNEKKTSALLVTAFGLLGILVSVIVSYLFKAHFFQETYPDLKTVLTEALYLFSTAFVEEVAWRGFLLRRILQKQSCYKSFLLVGVIWGLWHLPMWLIRNSVDMLTCILLFMWTVCISFVLGIVFAISKNILLTALLHMLFNMCYLAPIFINLIVIIIATVVLILWYQKLPNKKDLFGV